MSIALECPTCGKQYTLKNEFSGKKVRCPGCKQLFIVPEAEPEVEDLWDEEEIPQYEAPARSRGAESQGIPPMALWLGLGAAGVAVLVLIIGVVLMNSGSKPAPETVVQEAKADAPSLLDRMTGKDSESQLTDVENYPGLGDLAPPLLPPRPLRDLSEHEKRNRLILSHIGRLNDSLATVRDSASLLAVLQGFQNQSAQMQQEIQQVALPFRLSVREDAEVTRRLASESRAIVNRTKAESARISAIAGIGPGGPRLVALVDRLAGPMETALSAGEKAKIRVNGEPYAEVYAQMTSEDDEIYCRETLRSMCDEPSGMQWNKNNEFTRAAYRIWPVEDAFLFARRINFGKTKVEGRKIFVVLNPVSAADALAAREAVRKREGGPALAAAEAKKAKEQAEMASDPKPPAGADDMTKALFLIRSKSPFKREEGFRSLSELSSRSERKDDVTKALIGHLADPDGFFVMDVMRAMPEWQTDATLPALIKMLDDSRHNVRWDAANVLGKMHDASAAKPLLEHIKKDGIAVVPALKALGAAA